MNLFQRSLLSVLVLFLAASTLLGAEAAGKPSGADTKADEVWVYIGTYTTGPRSKGIYLSRMDPASGSLSRATLVGETQSPSFLAIHPNHHFLYAINEIDNFAGKRTGAVTAFAIDPKSGKLSQLNQKTSGGDGPCHVAVDATGRNVLLANYGGGSVESLPVGEDGRLGEPVSFIQHMGAGHDPKRQEGPHAHCIVLDPANKFALTADLGLDKVFIYGFDPAKGTLNSEDSTVASVAHGAGPRHLAFHPSGRFVYVISEMGSTITAFSYDGTKATMGELQTVSTLPADFHGSSTTAEIVIHPSGKFIYGSNRGHNSIASFSIDEQTGKLTPIGHQPTGGKTPRNFAIDPTGTWLLAANQDSDNIVVFKIDPKTGELKPTGTTLDAPMPVCILFAPAK